MRLFVHDMIGSVVTDMTISQIEAENTQMTNDLYRLLKKYSGLRNLIRELKVNASFFMFESVFLVNHVETIVIHCSPGIVLKCNKYKAKPSKEQRWEYFMI